MTPSLTTIRQPAIEKGETATGLLIDSFDAGKKPDTKVLNVKLIKRNSTGPAKPEQ